jgi:hypothetical protein
MRPLRTCVCGPAARAPARSHLARYQPCLAPSRLASCHAPHIVTVERRATGRRHHAERSRGGHATRRRLRARMRATLVKLSALAALATLATLAKLAKLAKLATLAKLAKLAKLVSTSRPRDKSLPGASSNADMGVGSGAGVGVGRDGLANAAAVNARWAGRFLLRRRVDIGLERPLLLVAHADALARKPGLHLAWRPRLLDVLSDRALYTRQSVAVSLLGRIALCTLRSGECVPVLDSVEKGEMRERPRRPAGKRPWSSASKQGNEKSVREGRRMTRRQELLLWPRFSTSRRRVVTRTARPPACLSSAAAPLSAGGGGRVSTISHPCSVRALSMSNIGIALEDELPAHALNRRATGGGRRAELRVGIAKQSLLTMLISFPLSL